MNRTTAMNEAGTMNPAGTTNFASDGPTSPDLSGYRSLHQALRLAPRRLAESARAVEPNDRRRIDAIARYWKGYAGEVLAHHTAEDRVVFPGLVRAQPSVATLIAQTDDEHHRLDSLMAEVGDGVIVLVNREPRANEQLARSLDDLAHLMEVHLDFEDAEILPLIEQHITVDEFDAMERQIVKDLGIGLQAAFTLPFVFSTMDTDERASTLATAPMVVRIIYRMTRGRHARLESAAFGATPVDGAS